MPSRGEAGIPDPAGGGIEARPVRSGERDGEPWIPQSSLETLSQQVPQVPSPCGTLEPQLTLFRFCARSVRFPIDHAPRPMPFCRTHFPSIVLCQTTRHIRRLTNIRPTLAVRPENVHIKCHHAERQGFEPWIPQAVYRFSRPAPSTTRPPLRRTEKLLHNIRIDCTIRNCHPQKRLVFRYRIPEKCTNALVFFFPSHQQRVTFA